LAVIMAGLLIAFIQGSTSPAVPPHSGIQPTPGQATAKGAAQPTQPPTPSSASNPAATPPAPQQGSPQQVAAQFLAAYFSWTPDESDQDYLKTWRALVVDTSVANLATAAPRLTLDNGDDSAATCPRLDIPASAVERKGGQAQMSFTWSIQVLPAGGELAHAQPRRIQATLGLVQNTTSWLIATIGWTTV
jgi:hypothetical protein